MVSLVLFKINPQENFIKFGSKEILIFSDINFIYFYYQVFQNNYIKFKDTIPIVPSSSFKIGNFAYLTVDKVWNLLIDLSTKSLESIERLTTFHPSKVYSWFLFFKISRIVNRIMKFTNILSKI